MIKKFCYEALNYKRRRLSSGETGGWLLRQPLRQLRQLRLMHNFLGGHIAFVTLRIFLCALRTFRSLRLVETSLTVKRGRWPSW